MADPYEIDPYEPDLPEPEDDEPIAPRPSAVAPLPRLWKAAPAPEPAEEVTDSKAKPKAKSESEPRARPRKKKDEQHDDGTGASKLEETPVLDTYQTRQRVRWLVGGVLAAVGVVSLIVILRTLMGGGAEEITAGELPDPRAVSQPQPPPRINPESEARQLVENARKADKAGKTKDALILLHKAADNYQGTAGSREALAAIDRDRRKLALFGHEGPEMTTGPKPPPPGSSAATGPSPPPPGPTTPTAPAPPSPEVGTAPAPAEVVKVNPAMPTRPIPAGFHAKPGAPIHPSGWPSQITCDRDGSVMVLVPGGTFLMGREDGEATERPAHWVAVSTYYIDQHEVTVRQYVQFLKETGRPIDSRVAPKETSDPPTNPDDLPVVNVSFNQAKAYCNWARKKLPTEAQWEMAARSSDGRISFWNGELPRKDPARGPRPMEPVMSLPSDVSPFGVFDLGANAWEWTSEFYDSQYYQQFRNLVTDPTGPRESPARIALATVKGGSKAGVLTWRDGLKLETRLPYLGFRGALPVEGAPVAPPRPTNTTPNQPLPGGVVPL